MNKTITKKVINNENTCTDEMSDGIIIKLDNNTTNRFNIVYIFKNNLNELCFLENVVKK